MCGLVGVISAGTLSSQEKKVFEELLHADMLRGDDSFGVINVLPIKKGASYYKIANRAPIMEKEDPAFSKFMAETCVARIGHNRAATRGAVTSENAHPFSAKHVMLVHNGTLRENIGNYKVDSEWLTNKIANSDNVASTLSEVDGAYAIIWHDSNEGVVNVARNSERPLYIAKSSAVATWYVCSEAKLLEWILDRNKVIHSGIKPVEAGKIHKFQTEYGSGKPAEVTSEVIPEKKYKSSGYYGGAYGDYSEYGQYSHSSTTNKATETDSSPFQKVYQSAVVEVIDWFPVYRPGNSSGEKTFALKAKINCFIKPFILRSGVNEGDIVMAIGVTESMLDNIVENEHCMAMVELYHTTACDTKYYTANHIIANGATEERRMHYTFPQDNISGIDLASVETIKCAYASGTSVKTVPLCCWADIVEDVESARASLNGTKEVTPDKEAPKSNVVPFDTKKQENVITRVVCSACSHPVLKGETTYVRGGQAICSACHMKYSMAVRGY